MKITIALIVLLAILGGIAFYENPLTVENVKTVTEYVEKTEVVSELDSRIKERQEASRPQLEASAKEAYDAAIAQGLLEIEHDVVAEYRAEIEAREEILSKEIGIF